MKFNELSIIYNSFLFLGILFTIISAFIGGPTINIINILAYSCLIAGLILIVGQMMITLNRTLYSDTASNTGLIEIFGIMKTHIGPFVLILGILGFLLYLNIRYKDKISSGFLPNDYYMFTNLNILVVCAEIYILFSGMQKTKNDEGEFLPLTYSTFLYLLCFVNINIAIIQYNILRYFTTDG